MTVVKSGYTGISAGTKGDWATLGASASTIVGKGLIYLSKQSKTLADALTKSGKTFLPTPTAIVDAAAFALLLVDFLNGFGTPNAGSAVATASDKFELFTTKLDPGCIPDARDWSGTAATAYIAQVAELKGFVATMKGYDQTLKGHLDKQAKQVAEAHMCITVNVAVLTAAAGIALALYLIPLVGPEISLAWQIIAAFACCMAVFALEMITLASSMSTANELVPLAQKYVALGKDIETKLAGTFGKIEGKVAAETSSRQSEFAGVSDSLKAYAAPPSISSLAAAAGNSASPSQRLVMNAYGAQEEAAFTSSAGAQTETPSAPAPAPAETAPAATATPVAAAGLTFTPPSAAQLSSLAGQASRISQQVSQPLNQTMQQVQQVAQMAQQGGQGAAPAPTNEIDEAADKAPAEDTADAGAASGNAGSERAPIDAPKSDAEAAAAGRERVL
jgi:EspA/EspE family